MESMGMIDHTPVPQESKKLWQYLSTFSACLMAMGVGTALAWTSPVLPKLTAKDSWLPMTEDEASWVGSLVAIGAAIGAVPAGTLADKLGRKRAILVLTAPFLFSWAMILLAQRVWLLCVARFLVGIGVGASCVLVPSYVAEIAEVSTRGTLGALFQLFLTLGIVYTFVLGAVLSYTGIAISCALVVVLFIGTFIWMPESPVWLVGQKRKPEATAALVVLRGDSYDPSHEITGMQKEAEDSASRKSSVFDLIRTRGARRALLACLGGMAFQQLSGINAVMFYTVNIFKAAGSSLNPDLAAIIIAIVQMIMSGIAAVIVDKAGRRPLLMSSSGVVSASLVALGLYFNIQERGQDVSNLGWLPLVSLTLFVVAFSIGLGPIPWMLMGEMFTVELKGTASGLAVMLNWFLAFFVTKSFPAMQLSLGAGVTFWIFAAIMAVATAFTYFVIPETKGKTLQAIQNELNGVSNANSSREV